MLICAKCKQTMKCVDIGKAVRWNKRYVKSTDVYQCESCGTRVMVAANQGCVDTTEVGASFVEMKEE